MVVYNSISEIPEYIKDYVIVPDSCNEEFFWFWFRQLFQKVVSVFDIKNLPPTIDETYFTNVVFTLGWLPIFEDDKYGLVGQIGFPYEHNLYFNPTKLRVGNLFINRDDLEVGVNCEIVRLTNDWWGPIDIITHYARRLALLETSLQVAIINTKLAYLLFPSSKPAAKAFEEVLKRVAQGEPAVISDSAYVVENMQSNNQEEPFQLISEDVANKYIIDKFLTDISRVMDEFDNEVGIPSSNTDKKERLISDEVSFGIADTVAKVDTWRKCLQDSLDKVNKLFGTNITFVYNFEDYGKEKDINERETVQNNR